MTPRERFMAALDCKPLTGRVPHFELVFFLTMEAFGKVHPTHRHFSQWDQMSDIERDLQRKDVADVYAMTAEKYEHSAIFPQGACAPGIEEELRQVDLIKERVNGERFIMLHGDATYAIPDGNTMLEFSYRMVDDPEGMKAEADANVNQMLERAEYFDKHGHPVDGFALCSDYCLNVGPFLSPNQFGEFVAPYLEKLIKGYRDMGYYTIKHTDGNIMPIVDQMVQCHPHALHSLDPQGGVDIKVLKDMYRGRVCLIGNVNCGLMQTGTDEEFEASVRYALQNGMPDYGYIFSTSNCIYTGAPLDRYERMLEIWRAEGNY